LGDQLKHKPSLGIPVNLKKNENRKSDRLGQNHTPHQQVGFSHFLKISGIDVPLTPCFK